MSYHAEKPYNRLPGLPPETDIETKVILKKTILASRALSELNGAITKLPNPNLFIDSINLQEARASSAIENIVTTQDALFKASIADKKIEDPATKEVIHYKNALWYGVQKLKKKPVLTTNLFISVVQQIRENQAGIRNTPGTKLTNSVGKTVYTPPEGENLIRQKLKELEDFIHKEDNIDPLVKMALIHYQFEAIHPFYDGNGRTGRIIILLYLQFSGLMKLPALYLSRYIIEHKEDYYKNLREVTEKGGWENWIIYMLEMIEQTAKDGQETIHKIEQLMKKTGSAIQKTLPKVYSKDLLEILFKLPYTKRQFLKDARLGNLRTVGNYLKKLEAAGFLQSEQVGKEKLYLNEPLMKILKKEKQISQISEFNFKQDLFELNPDKTVTIGENIEINYHHSISESSRFILLVETSRADQEFVVYLSIHTDQNKQKWIAFGNVLEINNRYESEHVFRIGYPNSLNYFVSENIPDKIKESGLTFEGIPKRIEKIRFRCDQVNDLSINFYYKVIE